MRRTTLLCLLALGCPRQGSTDVSATSKAPTQDRAEQKSEQAPSADDEAKRKAEQAHDIVFADRTSHSYLLLVDHAHATKPTREDLKVLMKAKLGTKSDEPEMLLLNQLIETVPHDTRADPTEAPGSPRATHDLLGFYVDVLPVGSGNGQVVPDAVLADPILTRGLTEGERASLGTRKHALLLRADYRNQYAVRGLRLLQTAVRVVASERGALIHDPDTQETLGVEAFSERRLQSSLGNVADQIAVVPFIDKNDDNAIRLATRGMRRFGSVDVELDGLPRDPKALEQATMLLNGLAYTLVRLGEFDTSGYAVALDDIVEVDVEDVVRSYGARGGVVPRCDECQSVVEVHLVERPPEPHDPSDHVTARLIAPRDVSDDPAYDHTKWAVGVTSALFEK